MRKDSIELVDKQPNTKISTDPSPPNIEEIILEVKLEASIDQENLILIAMLED